MTTPMHLCRNPICGKRRHDAHPYCDECREFTPICPSCGAVYGEHRLDCGIPDGYDDCGEGPWATEEQAETFARAEVGLPWGAFKGADKQWYVVVKHEDD